MKPARVKIVQVLGISVLECDASSALRTTDLENAVRINARRRVDLYVFATAVRRLYDDAKLLKVLQMLRLLPRNSTYVLTEQLCRRT